MSVIDNPIINGPYDIPARHWRFDEAGGITDELVDGRRPSESWVPVHQNFFVRHAYFSGGGDPCARLEKALKAEAAWQSLCGTRSRPFPEPSSGRIAVKAINDCGDEVRKVVAVP